MGAGFKGCPGVGVLTAETDLKQYGNKRVLRTKPMVKPDCVIERLLRASRALSHAATIGRPLQLARPWSITPSVLCPSLSCNLQICAAA